MSIRIRTNINFNKVKGATDEAIKIGLYAGGTIILKEANQNAPKPPIDWGVLRGSASIVVAGGPEYKPKPNNPKNVTIHEPNKSGMEKNSVRISYNTEYAAKLHDSPNWKPVAKKKTSRGAGEEGSIGNMWLAKAMTAAAKDAKKAVGDAIKEALQ